MNPSKEETALVILVGAAVLGGVFWLGSKAVDLTAKPFEKPTDEESNDE